MTSLRLNLNSPVVDLAVRWTKEEKQFRVGVLEPFSSSIWQEKLRDFKLRGLLLSVWNVVQLARPVGLAIGTSTASWRTSLSATPV